MYEDPKSKISQLEKVLYAREDLVTKKIRRHELNERETVVSPDWDDTDLRVGEEIHNQSAPVRHWTGPGKILLSSVIFFVLALLVVAFRFFGGGNIVSGDNIAVTVRAPISIAGGETLAYEIEIKNNNNVSLLGADLGVTYPVGAQEVTDTSIPAKRVQSFIGDIAPGQTIKKNLAVALFGAENEKKDINLVLEYKVTGSNSLFNKNKVFTVLLTSAPVSLVVTGPKEVNTNQTVDFTVEVTSNSTVTVKNLLLKAEYPFGFTFVSSNPKTFSKNNLWLIGDLEPGGKRTIKLSGVLSGQEAEERGVNFSLGVQSKTDSLAIDAPFVTSLSAITIRRPFVSADIFVNGSTDSEYVSSAGGKVETVISWRNNLSTPVSNVSITVKLSGNSLNKATVQADGGFYRSTDNTIIFNKTTDSSLANLEPGQTGESKFTFSSFGVNTVTGAGLSNPTIGLDVSVSGERTDIDAGPGSVLFSDARRIKITSNPQIYAKSLYYVGPFTNRGPIPPKAESETTYTVTWTVTNPLNNLSGAQVQATLPPYIKWLGVVSPAREKMNYDEGTGALVWSIGNISAGAGTISPAKEVSFQIAFTPSVGQIGTAPDLVGEAVLTAKDSFTLTAVSDTFSALTTRLANDPYFKTDAENVVQ
jgi:hypothetical protein